MSELTREQVARECQWLIEEHCSSAAEKWLSTDAAQRRTIEQQAQEIARLEGEARGNHARIEQLDEQLAAMTTERDAARSAAREIITKLEAERDQANEARQRAVDSLAKMIEQR